MCVLKSSKEIPPKGPFAFIKNGPSVLTLNTKGAWRGFVIVIILVQTSPAPVKKWKMEKINKHYIN